MADEWDRHNPPRLMGYESWLYQMPCMDNSGDVFVSVPLSKDADLLGKEPSRWLLALGDLLALGHLSVNGETAYHLKNALATELIRLVGTTTDPASILDTLISWTDPPMECLFVTLLVAVVDGDHHELTLASAGHVYPLIRRVDRRVESFAEDVGGYPLWIVPGQTYENVTVPIGPGEVLVLYTDGLTTVIDHQGHRFDLNSLRLAIVQAADGAASVGSRSLKPFVASDRDVTRWTISLCSA